MRLKLEQPPQSKQQLAVLSAIPVLLQWGHFSLLCSSTAVFSGMKQDMQFAVLVNIPRLTLGNGK